MCTVSFRSRRYISGSFSSRACLSRSVPFRSVSNLSALLSHACSSRTTKFVSVCFTRTPPLFFSLTHTRTHARPTTRMHTRSSPTHKLALVTESRPEIEEVKPRLARVERNSKSSKIFRFASFSIGCEPAELFDPRVPRVIARRTILSSLPKSHATVIRYRFPAFAGSMYNSRGSNTRPVAVSARKATRRSSEFVAPTRSSSPVRTGQPNPSNSLRGTKGNKGFWARRTRQTKKLNETTRLRSISSNSTRFSYPPLLFLSSNASCANNKDPNGKKKQRKNK